MNQRSRALPPSVIADAVRAACRAELLALKPGNVHVHAAGHGMQVAQFEAAADMASHFIGEPFLPFGERVRAAVGASIAEAGCNTNLGIVLLCAPLAAAALMSEPVPLRQRVETVLANFDSMDAVHVYAAICLANPGGLGRSEQGDVAAPPTMPLLDAMRLAAPRDRIAAAYANGFRDIFDDHLDVLAAARAAVAATSGATEGDAVATLHMSLLARFPDSHIRRKYGMETAVHVQALAKAARARWHPLVTADSMAALLDLDGLLKSNGWNPGTTADFVVATLLASDLQHQAELSPLV